MKSGRLVVDEPVNLPEGMVLDLVIDDEEDDLSDDERVVLHSRLASSAAEAAGGKTRPIAEFLSELRTNR